MEDIEKDKCSVVNMFNKVFSIFLLFPFCAHSRCWISAFYCTFAPFERDKNILPAKDWFEQSVITTQMGCVVYMCCRALHYGVQKETYS